MFDPQTFNPRWAVFRSHKIVRAAQITAIWSNTCVGVGPDKYSVVFDPDGKPTPEIGWYAIAYEDGYLSFCPATQFQGGYNELPKPHRDASLEACARAAHEANRAYCLAIGDNSQPSWEDAPEWQRTSAYNGVRGVVDGNTPEQSHESWLAEKRATGWKYGVVKNPAKKEHPCFVPYDELPTAQRAKDGIYVAVVNAMAEGLREAAEYIAECDGPTQF